MHNFGCFKGLEKNKMDYMNDLKIAKNRLKKNDLSLVIVKNGKIVFETKEKKIVGFIDAIEKIGNAINGSCIADKVVGKAVAFLCIYKEAKSVYAKILSEKAKRLFEEWNIVFEYGLLVEEILNTNKNNVCPFELKAKNLNNPKKAYYELKKLANSLRSQK